MNKNLDQILSRGLLDPYDLSDEPDEWFVLKPYTFWSARYQITIQVPKWMITDLSSIPKPLRWFISVNERHRLPSLLHDCLYNHPSGLTRKECDNVFKDFCLHFKVPKWKTQLMYYGVRLFGSRYYHKKIKEMPSEHREYYREIYKTTLEDP